MRIKITILIVALVSLLAISIVELAEIRDEKKHDQILETANYCYQAANQCGLHNILEEAEYETSSLDMTIQWLEQNIFNLPEYDIERGLEIVKYLKSLNYERREIFVNEVQLQIIRDRNQ